VETALTQTLIPPIERSSAAVSPESFDEIVRRHQQRVYRVVLLLVKDQDTADTITQECFLRAYRGLAGFRGECRMDTWLLRIAINLVRDHNKSRRTSFWRKLVGLEDFAETAPEFHAPQPSAERALLARAELQAVWASVGALSPQQRQIFVLRFVEELPLAEIATLLGLRVGSVKAQLFRALGSIRTQMKEQQWR
jgi:RNA polymerase sigma-70 factor, ECF subfamily